jgi:hypothetical protein
MDDRHLRAVIRAGLRAGGFEVPAGELAAADRRIRVLGLRLRDLLLERLPGFPRGLMSRGWLARIRSCGTVCRPCWLSATSRRWCSAG